MTLFLYATQHQKEADLNIIHIFTIYVHLNLLLVVLNLYTRGSATQKTMYRSKLNTLFLTTLITNKNNNHSSYTLNQHLFY